MDRSSGILLHITSLPSPYGIGTLGEEAFAFVDFLAQSGQGYWQILPIHPTGYGNSPYQTFSTFAGNPYLIDLETLISQELLTADECAPLRKEGSRADYMGQYTYKIQLLKKAYQRWGDGDKLERFCSAHCSWLEDFSAFMALKTQNHMQALATWENAALRQHEPEAVEKFVRENQREVDFWKFTQYLFFTQWEALKDYAASREIKIIGDIPIYVSADSADVWACPEVFQLDAQRTPICVAGCPPDYFSVDGQYWGNPVYDWMYLKQTGYEWWMQRLQFLSKIYDVLRIDHFRGFEAYYTIPYGQGHARGGQWIKGPGMDFVGKIKKNLHSFPLIAEDLGYLTEDVKKLLEESGYPGMKVLQFAFDHREPSDYLPHNYTRNCVVYTGTHDNTTAVGWFESADKKDVAYAAQYGAFTREEGYHIGLIRLALSSVAQLAIIPMQDYLGLGENSRMNTPSTVNDSNWSWRLEPGYATKELIERIYSMSQRYGRAKARPKGY